jgi:integrase
MPLKPEQVTAAIRSGIDQKIPDGNNLYLVVRKGRGFWVLQYREGEKIRSKGLGSAAKVSPAKARRAREAFVVGRRTRVSTSAPSVVPSTTGTAISAAPDTARKQPDGVDNTPPKPISQFGDIVEEFIFHRARMKSWKGGIFGAEAESYRRTLTRMDLAKVPIASITTADVLSALSSMPAVTAEKTRTRIACVLDWARVMGYRDASENVARRRGHMEYLLSDIPKAQHHAALPWPDVPDLMSDLRAIDSPAARALQWTILTVARAGETLGATRSEIKSPLEFAQLAKLPIRFIQGETWVIPPERMKEGQQHCVPLSDDALALLGESEGTLFEGHQRQMLDLIHQLRPGYTVHGFRSSFADWAAEHDYPQELREMALAHSVGDSVEQAYRHSTRICRRREMMVAWSEYAVAHPSRGVS